jgi:uncharacterized protein (TIGR02145 family)
MRSKIVTLICILALVFMSQCEKDDDNSIKDGDGNVYTSVQIGAQVWLVENLKTTHYNDGEAIPLVTDSNAWGDLSTPAYCWYNNDVQDYKDIYGALYNWYAANTGKLCPKGWHVPTDSEWTTLTTYLGGESVAGGKLKETGTTHWNSPNTGATNETGFTALPGGWRSSYGRFCCVRNFGTWWSTTYDYLQYGAWFRGMEPDLSSVSGTVVPIDRGFGLSVRCVKD